MVAKAMVAGTLDTSQHRINQFVSNIILNTELEKEKKNTGKFLLLFT